MPTPTVDGGTPSGLPTPSAVENTTTKIILAVLHQLQDIVGNTISAAGKWDILTTLLPYLNLGIKEIVNLKPDAYPVTKNITLVAGATQSLPAGDIGLLDVICNMGTDGTTVGDTIGKMEKGKMDDFLPGWMAYTATAGVSYVVYDPRTPKTFYVFPPQISPATQKIKVVVSSIPTRLTTLGDTFPLDDSYEPAAVDYVVYRALAEETTIPNALSKATIFLNKFMADLGFKTNVERQTKEQNR